MHRQKILMIISSSYFYLMTNTPSIAAEPAPYQLVQGSLELVSGPAGFVRTGGQAFNAIEYGMTAGGSYVTDYNNWAGSRVVSAAVSYTPDTGYKPLRDAEILDASVTANDCYVINWGPSFTTRATIQKPTTEAATYCYQRAGHPTSTRFFMISSPVDSYLTVWNPAPDDAPPEITVTVTATIQYAAGPSYVPWGGRPGWGNTERVVYRYKLRRPQPAVSITPPSVHCGTVPAAGPKVCLPGFTIQTEDGRPLGPGTYSVTAPADTLLGGDSARIGQHGVLQILANGNPVPLDGRTTRVSTSTVKLVPSVSSHGSTGEQSANLNIAYTHD